MTYTIHCATCATDIGPLPDWDATALVLDSDHAHHSYTVAPTE